MFAPASCWLQFRHANFVGQFPRYAVSRALSGGADCADDFAIRTNAGGEGPRLVTARNVTKKEEPEQYARNIYETSHCRRDRGSRVACYDVSPYFTDRFT